MVRFDRILCPVDGSTFAEGAIRYATTLATWYRGTATAVYVHRSPPAPALWAEYPLVLPVEDDGGADEQAILAFVRKATRDRMPVAFRRGFVVPEIVRLAREMPADLIVMGTHGAGGLEHLVLGSVTENVLRRAACPVLTIPKPAADDASRLHVEFKTIVCAIDFSRDSKRALDFALALAQESCGRLVLVHALEHFEAHETRTNAHYNVPEFRRSVIAEARQQLDALVPPEARAWCAAEPIVACGNAAREVRRIADQRGADLIVLGVHGRYAFDLALFGSTTAKVLHQAPCPVLTVPRDAGADAAAA